MAGLTMHSILILGLTGGYTRHKKKTAMVRKNACSPANPGHGSQGGGTTWVVLQATASTTTTT